MDIPDKYITAFEKLEKYLNEIDLVEMRDKSVYLLPALRKSQEVMGCVPDFAQKTISKHLKIKKAEILKVIDAYLYLNIEPVADNRISFCHGPVCHTKGSMQIEAAVRASIGLADGLTETTDKQFSVKSTYCKGGCRQGPMATINARPFYNLEAKTFCELVEKRRHK